MACDQARHFCFLLEDVAKGISARKGYQKTSVLYDIRDIIEHMWEWGHSGSSSLSKVHELADEGMQLRKTWQKDDALRAIRHCLEYWLSHQNEEEMTPEGEDDGGRP